MTTGLPPENAAAEELARAGTSEVWRVAVDVDLEAVTIGAAWVAVTVTVCIAASVTVTVTILAPWFATVLAAGGAAAAGT